MKLLALSALMGLAFAANSQISTVCPSEVCYSINIPQNTASSGKGDIYIQMSAPTSYSWFGLGQGQMMAGSNIFVVYASANGKNITLSTRSGTGNVMPQRSRGAQVHLLEGSGIQDGKMIANFRCSNCQSWNGGSMNFGKDSTNWIHASLKGDSLKTDDTAAVINQHEDDYGPFSWDISSAKGGSSLNPFLNSDGTQPSTNVTMPNFPSGFMKVKKEMVWAHGLLAAITFVILFPSGAIFLRVFNFKGNAWVHGIIQTFSYITFIAAAGLGIYIAKNYQMLTRAHPIIGLVLLSVLFFQPIGGILHHAGYKKTGGRTAVSYGHIWLGRSAIILGMINGGLGLKLAGKTGSGSKVMIAYIVLAVVFGTGMLASAALGEWRHSRQAPRAVKRSSNDPL